MPLASQPVPPSRKHGPASVIGRFATLAATACLRARLPRRLPGLPCLACPTVPVTRSRGKASATILVAMVVPSVTSAHRHPVRLPCLACPTVPLTRSRGKASATILLAMVVPSVTSAHRHPVRRRRHPVRRRRLPVRRRRLPVRRRRLSVRRRHLVFHRRRHPVRRHRFPNHRGPVRRHRRPHRPPLPVRRHRICRHRGLHLFQVPLASMTIAGSFQRILHGEPSALGQV